jgi:hypothetical protein
MRGVRTRGPPERFTPARVVSDDVAVEDVRHCAVTKA